MTSVIILGRPGCGACIFTKRALELAGISYEVRDIDTDQVAAALARRVNAEYKTLQLPVVVCENGTTWTGLQLHQIAELIRR